MKKPYILFISPSSYPIYGAEGFVNAKLIKTLTEGGCKVDLISRGVRNNFVVYPPETNISFYSKVNSIYEIPTNTSYNFKTLLRHVATLIKTGYVFKGIDWVLPAIKKCEALIKTNKYDYIYTFDYPSEVVGVYLAKKHGIKWVSTWNDPYMLVKYPEPYGKGANAKIPYFRKKLIADIGKHSYKNIFPSERLRDYMLGYMTNMRKDSCVICPHIIVKEFEKENTKETGDFLSILHSGNLGSERNPKNIFEGLHLFLKHCPEAKIKMSFLGIKDNVLTPYIEKYGLQEYVETIAPVPYLDSLETITNYDVCMLIEAPCKEGIFLPSKVIDYMQKHKPIFAVSPANGVLNDMFQNCQIDYFADVNNPYSIFIAFNKMYEDFMNHNLGLDEYNITDYKDSSIFQTHVRDIWGVC